MTAHHYLYLLAAVLALVFWNVPLEAEDDVTVITTPAAKPATSQTQVASDGTPVIHKSLHKKKKPATTDTASGSGAPTAPTAPAASTAPATVASKPAPTAPTPVTPPPAPTVISITHPQPASIVAQAAAKPPLPVAPVAPPAPIKSPVVVIEAVRPSSGVIVSSPPPLVAPSVVNPGVVVTVTPHSQAVAPTYTLPPSAPVSKITSVIPTVSHLAVAPNALVPQVETGLPVARYPGMGSPIQGVSTYVPTTMTVPTGKSITGSTTRQPMYASLVSTSVIPLTSSAAGSYSTPGYGTPSRTTTPSTDFVFTNYGRKPKVTYPWKTGIVTTMFYIGEGGSSISATDNKASSWDERWVSSNHGTDDPNSRNGFASADHASTVNPFYVALPFNDLVYPDMARESVPRSWHRPREDGKEVSACKDRWVCIKNSNGRSCYAQWEDVGPLRYDDANYVFSGGRPIGLGDDHAGLDVSPAVAQYLGINDDKKTYTSWKFVDDADVPPGQWLKYDEQAVIYTALHQLKNTFSPSSDLPIQKATEPIDDQNIDSNKKKADISKG